MSKKIRTYQENFIAGVKYWMAKNNIPSIKEAAKQLEIGYMALYKVMDGTNNPTVDACILLCKKAGYSANWLLLNKGEISINDQENITQIFKEIRDLKNKLKMV